MDKIGIISDIHGNYTALQKVLTDMKYRNINFLICLGDLVTKCANPDKVIDTLRKEADVVIKGNCDNLICKNKNYSWSRNKVGEERLEYLDNLPVFYEFYLSGHLVRLFHASPYSLEHVYNPMFSNANTRYKDKEIKSPEEMFLNTEFLGKNPDAPIPDIIGYGHLHTPNLFRYKNKTIFNPGSVGIPMEMANRDSNDPNNKLSTLTSYMILEGELNSTKLSEISFNLIRIPYNIESEIEDLKNSNMPNASKVIHNLRTATYQE